MFQLKKIKMYSELLSFAFLANFSVSSRLDLKQMYVSLGARVSGILYTPGFCGTEGKWFLV